MDSVTSYASEFNIRIVYMYNYPYPNLGVAPNPTMDGTSGTVAAYSYVVFVIIAELAQNFFWLFSS